MPAGACRAARPATPSCERHAASRISDLVASCRSARRLRVGPSNIDRTIGIRTLSRGGRTTAVSLVSGAMTGLAGKDGPMSDVGEARFYRRPGRVVVAHLGARGTPRRLRSRPRCWTHHRRRRAHCSSWAQAAATWRRTTSNGSTRRSSISRRRCSRSARRSTRSANTGRVTCAPCGSAAPSTLSSSTTPSAT